MSEFTHGPWKAQISDPNIYIRQEGHIAFPIAYVGRVHHEKEAETNAYLLSAAPEMYEVLKRLVESSTDKRDIDFAKKVLAKAEGKTVERG